MRNAVFAETVPFALAPNYVTYFAVNFATSKHAAKQAKKAMIQQGVIAAVGGDVVKLNPTDWAVVLVDTSEPNSLPLPIAKGLPQRAEAEQAAAMFRKVLPPTFAVSVAKFSDTAVYQHLNHTTTELMGGILCVINTKTILSIYWAS